MIMRYAPSYGERFLWPALIFEPYGTYYVLALYFWRWGLELEWSRGSV